MALLRFAKKKVMAWPLTGIDVGHYVAGSPLDLWSKEQLLF